jgi:hypothetical protein
MLIVRLASTWTMDCKPGQSYRSFSHPCLPLPSTGGLPVGHTPFSRLSPVNGHDLPGGFLHTGCPGNKTSLKGFGIQIGEHFPWGVVRSNPFLKRGKIPQVRQLLFPVFHNVHPGFRSENHPIQNQQQDFAQRIQHVFQLSGVFQLVEML